MNYLNTLRQRRKTPAAAWHKLRTLQETNKYDCYFICEGEEDEDFFSKCLEDNWPELNFKMIVCDGKGGVLGLADRVRADLPEAIEIAYLVDRDHDRYIGIDEYGQNVYATDHYSVESYSLDRRVVSDTIFRYLKIRKNDPLHAELLSNFDRDAMVFVRACTMPFLYCATLRKLDVDVDVDAVRLSDLIKFTDEGAVLDRSGFNRWREGFRDQIIGIDSELRVSAKKLGLYGPLSVIRGKMVSSFIASFLSSISKVFGNRLKENGHRVRCSVNFGKSNVFGLIVDFIECPASFRLFVDDFLSHLRPPALVP
ncbi:DUF4435 domain-containing protein [Amaricoccus solimangrovi]|uniref:DUF4435 domain-containing protein n=1 Tax=Amaricoccus solimangrovi TaxID=2589815 RepID=A0A501WHY4_9RHOB|nr:DUF4435 domain-containing protein [Amaricoccus solimangrovi]TPE47970.1 DUF4435 domain-containing protein [Amaricoccus solimangrovi]